MVSDSCFSRFPVRAKVYTVGVDTRNIPFRMPAFWKKYVPAGNLFCSVGCSSVSRGHTTPMILGPTSKLWDAHWTCPTRKFNCTMCFFPYSLLPWPTSASSFPQQPSTFSRSTNLFSLENLRMASATRFNAFAHFAVFLHALIKAPHKTWCDLPVLRQNEI